MKMFMLSYLRIVGTVIMIQISTQPYVCGRPSPPAFYDFETTVLPYEAEPLPTGFIAGLTPEESLDVVEKIIQGELQPVVKTADLSFEPIEVSEIPSSTNRKYTDFMDAPKMVDDSVSYFDPPQLIDKPNVSAMIPEQEPPIIENPSFYNPSNKEILASPESYPLIEDSIEWKESPVASVISESQPRDNDVSIHVQDVPLYSTQNLPEVGQTSFINNNFAHPASIHPTDNSVQDKMLLSESTSLQHSQNINSFLPESHNTPINSFQNVQDSPKIVNGDVEIKSVDPESSLLKSSSDMSIEEIIPTESSVDSFVPEDHGKSSSVSRDVQGNSHEEVRQSPEMLDSSVLQDLSGQDIVQDLTEIMDTGIGDYPLNYPEGTLEIEPSEESIAARQTTPEEDSDPIHDKKHGMDSPVGHSFTENSVGAVPNLADKDSTSIIEDKPVNPKHSEAADDLGVGIQVTDLQPDHHSDNSKRISDREGTAIKNDMLDALRSVILATPKDRSVLAKSKKDVAAGPVGVQQRSNNVPLAVSKTIEQPTKDFKVNPEISYLGFKNFKPSSLLHPKKSLNLASQPSMNGVKTLLPKRLEAPYTGSDKITENITFDRKIQAPVVQAQPAIGIKEIGQGKPTDVDKVTIPTKDFDYFRTVDTDRLDISDILDSRQDSKSDELLWSAEDSEEDDEFWKKVKRFIEYENTLPKERDKFQFDTTTPSVNSMRNVNAIPYEEIKPTETPIIHVMKIPKSRPDDTPSGKETDDYYGELERGTDGSIQISDDFPVQEESSTVFPANDELTATNVTTPEASLTLNDEFDGTNGDVVDYNSTNFATTEGSLSYTVPPTEWQEYTSEPAVLEYDTVTAQNDGDSDAVQTDAVNFEVAATSENVFDKLTKSEISPKFRDSDTVQTDAVNFEVAATSENVFDKPTKSEISPKFRKEQPKQTSPNDILSNSREFLQGNVGGSDYVPELKTALVSSQDDPRFNDGFPENFTTDEPLVADVEKFLESPTQSHASVSKQEREPLYEPTDLDVIEADNPVPTLSNVKHFVSKKDDPLNTVKHVQVVELKDKRKSKTTRPEILPKAPHNFVYPSPLDALSRRRVRRSDEDTKDGLDKHSFNDIESSTHPESATASPQPDSSNVSLPIPSTSPSLKPILPTSPSPVSISESPEGLSSSMIQSPSTVTVPLDPTFFPETPTLSTKSTTLSSSTTTVNPAPSTASTNIAPTSKVTTLAPPATSTTSALPTTFEMLPTPLPYTSTTVNPLTSTLIPTSSTAPKKKKKMVWKIPYYPDNIAITSSGEIRREPKNKSAKMQTTTTQKPMLLRDRLRVEDLQAARARLLKRFQSMRPSTVPVSDVTGSERIKYHNGQPLMLTPSITNQNSIGVQSVRPKVTEDVLAFVTAENPSELPSLLYNSPEEREEARRRRLKSMVGLAGDVRSLFSDRARSAVRTVNNFVGGGAPKKDKQ